MLTRGNPLDRSRKIRILSSRDRTPELLDPGEAGGRCRRAQLITSRLPWIISAREGDGVRAPLLARVHLPRQLQG